MPLPDNHTTRMQRALLALEGVAIGDAFGEMLSTQGASARTRVDQGLGAGPWFHTDDTEMALAIVEVLHTHGRIVPDELALCFAERFRRDPDRGYGAMASRILRQILNGHGWKEAAEAAFEGMGSMGNGAAMRIAPLGAYFAGDPALRGEASLSAITTHAHREAQAGAIAVAFAASFAWEARGLPNESASADLLDAVIEQTPEGETRTGLIQATRIPLSTSTRIAARHLGNGSAVTAPDTVPFAVWSAAKHLHDFREAMIETVSAGGDCDTNCAIVGGIVALSVGLESIPDDWREAREPFTLKPA